MTALAWSPSVVASPLMPGSIAPSSTFPSGSGALSLPGFSTISTSPRTPTASIDALASACSGTFSFSASSTRTLPTRSNTMRSTLPTCTPDTLTGELVLRLPMSAKWTGTTSRGPKLLPPSHIVPMTKTAALARTMAPTAASRL